MKGEKISESKLKGCRLKHDTEEYVEVLRNPEIKKFQEYEQITRTKNYDLVTVKLRKTSLTAFQDKMLMKNCMRHMESYGYSGFDVECRDPDCSELVTKYKELEEKIEFEKAVFKAAKAAINGSSDQEDYCSSDEDSD